jgi:hypothetical protein
VAALVQALVRTVIDGLGGLGLRSERHRAWIRPLFVAVLVAGCIVVVYALVASARE